MHSQLGFARLTGRRTEASRPRRFSFGPTGAMFAQFRLCSLLALSLICVDLAAQEIYKWVDEVGRVHYSDQPPEGIVAERVPLAAPSRATRDPSEELRRVVEQADRARIARRNDRLEAQATRDERVLREQICSQARMTLAILQEQRPVYRDEHGQFRPQWAQDTYTGNRDHVDAATRAVEVARAERDIAQSCLNPGDANEQALARRRLALSELCAAGRAELTELERPSARTPRSELEPKRAAVSAYCTQ